MSTRAAFNTGIRYLRMYLHAPGGNAQAADGRRAIGYLSQYGDILRVSFDEAYIAILDLIEPPKVKVADGQIPPDDPLVATYRRRLSSVVLS